MKAKVWLYPGETAAWHFASIPKTVSEKMKKHFGTSAKGWGSLPVDAKIGKTTWRTSIFPDKRSGTYLLPLKAEIRKKEEIFDGDTIRLSLSILLH